MNEDKNPPPHTPENGLPVVCDDCGWEFPDRSRFEAHLSDLSFIHTRVIPPGDGDDCTCGHDHGVSTTTCDRCYWCQQETRPTPPGKGDER